MPISMKSFVHYDRCITKRRLNVTASARDMHHHVAVELLVNERRARPQSFFGVRDYRQFFIFDVHKLRRILGQITALRKDCDDALAHIANLLCRQTRPFGLMTY